MFISNITIKVNKDITSDWLDWQLNEHIPEVMDTGLFTEHKFFRLLDQDETEGPTYIVQFLTEDINNYKHYIEKHAPLLRDKAIQRWGGGFIAFRSLLETVN
jgi:hypothetical protein